jgi:hypothetical protein
MAKGTTKSATPMSVDPGEQAFYDAMTVAIDPFRNVLPKERAAKILELQTDMTRNDESWVTYEGGPTPPEPPAAPTLVSLSPNAAVAGDAADITMRAIGTGFTADSIITFNGLNEPTTFVSETEVTTGVKPSLFVVPAVCPVEVHTGSVVSGPLDFTFTEPVTRSSSSKGKENEHRPSSHVHPRK